MLLQRLNRENPEKIFIVAKNSTSSTMTNGQPAVWDYITDKDGVGVEKPRAIGADNRGNAFAGIAAESIAASDYGLFQVYGYHSAVICTPATGDSITTGTPLYLPVTSGLYLETNTVPATDSTHIDKAAYVPCAFALAAYTKAGTTSAIACFIKGL